MLEFMFFERRKRECCRSKSQHAATYWRSKRLYNVRLQTRKHFRIGYYNRAFQDRLSFAQAARRQIDEEFAR